MASADVISEADILNQVVAGARAELSPETARSLLGFRFDATARRRIRRLLQKNNRGTISAAERATLDGYLRVGQLLDLLHARARLTPQQADGR